MAFDYGNANEEQKKAISTTEGPLLIIAGPGTGKTYTLVKRIVYLIIEKKVAPEKIMVATFTEKAAKELITRITNELHALNISVNINEMYVGTFHSICLRILGEHLEHTGLKKNYRQIDSFEQQYLVYRKMKQFYELPEIAGLLSAKKGRWKHAKDIVNYVNLASEELVDIEEMKKDSDTQIQVIANMVSLYRQIAEDENLIDFSRMQTETYELMIEHPEILRSLQEKIEYIMVDEYQDTNYIQEQIVFMIGRNHQNICVVGDDDQGLYRFRGATIRNILEFPSKFKDKKCKQVKLVKNYRSEKQIIDFYNTWMNHTTGSGFAFSWGKYRYEKEIVAGKQGGNKGISVFKCSGLEYPEEWYWSVYSFMTALKRKEVITDYNQIAFLCRSVKNKNITGLIHFLEKNGIPVYSPRSEMFFKRQEVREAIGCIMLSFPQYMKKFNNREYTYMSEELYHYYESCCSAVKPIYFEYKETLGKWLDQKRIEHVRMGERGVDYGFTGFLYQLFAFEPFKSYLTVGGKENVMDGRAARNLSRLTEFSNKFDYLHRLEFFHRGNVEAAVERFLNSYLRLLFEEGIAEFEDDSEYAPSGCVSFMTIHQAKGMEFPVVMVDSLDTSPSYYPDQAMDKIEQKYFKRKAFEQREDVRYFDFWRLYYTAFSRAQNLLVLTCNERPWSRPSPSVYFQDLYNGLPDFKEIDWNQWNLEKVKPVQVKETYSYTSHIALYQNCPTQYKFFKEFEFTKQRVGATLFGTLVHETIEDIHKAVLRGEKESIVPKTIQVWFDHNYETLSKSEHFYLGEDQKKAAFKQVLRYVDRRKNDWDSVKAAEVEVSEVKSDYILMGKVDLICGRDDTLELYDFKSGKRPNVEEDNVVLESYKKQLEVYAHLVKQKTGKKVEKMHLYYTGEEYRDPVISFDYEEGSIEETMKEFDLVVEKIENKEFEEKAKDTRICAGCEMRFYCGR